MPQLGRLLVLLALWGQLLLPVAAVHALAAHDPLAGMTICGHVVGDATEADAGSGAHHAAMPSCGLCCAAVAVLDAPPAAAGGVALIWTHHVFAVPADAAAARAKPELPRARDPPALA